MREVMIEMHIDQLTESLGGIKKPVVLGELESLYIEEEYTKMVGFIARSIKLDGLKILVGLVNSGGPKGAPAWMALPSEMPALGTPEFSKMKVHIFIRKSFIKDFSFEVLVFSIAYQLSTVLIRSIDNALTKEKEAIVLAVMVLGYSELLIRCNEGDKKIFATASSDLMSQTMDDGSYSWAGLNTSRHSLSSLTIQEIRFAKKYIEERASA